ncbi:hypothetical protein QBC38DRAFT_383538 [Podospora fimiseda]|uniref:Thiol-specific monooxygenase n=1 Tax=Podospora fimiseda TaxID=252190 RepID=A0AAN7BW90_9PEZI|nr:hypothetical protein QBC38DRAFT_383538 [Podospora fimiseda]
MDFKNKNPIKSVAIIGAGAAGAVTAAAFEAEKYYENIRVFERRETPGGTWIYDSSPSPQPPLQPGALAPEIDPPLTPPDNLPQTTPPNKQYRYFETPIYNSLTTNVPDIAMSFSDSRFSYGPFAPHHIPRQYIETYFSTHKTDPYLILNTTLELLTKTSSGGWKLTLRTHSPLLQTDKWYTQTFDAVILATGHYSIPFIPFVPGLSTFPRHTQHSKTYRSPIPYKSKRVLIIGNSASGHDISQELVSTALLPVYVSRRSPSRWDGDSPPKGIEWKPTVKEYFSSGRIVFSDDTYLDDIDHVIYCTGYQVSFPFWDSSKNGKELWDYKTGRLTGNYQHTFLGDFPTLAAVGMPRVLTFRSFEYQAVALARYWAGRNAVPLPGVKEQEKWELSRAEERRRERRNFHDIAWDDGETEEWLGWLFRFAGLGTLRGEGRIPPVLSEEVIWAVENLKKYPEPGNDNGKEESLEEEEDWVVVERKG